MDRGSLAGDRAALARREDAVPGTLGGSGALRREKFGEVEITSEFADADSRVFFWRADLAGRLIEGADLLRCDEHGKIAEIRVLIRPLADIAVFASAIGPPLAVRRSPTRGALVRLLTLPLKVILAVADAVASRLIKLH